MMIDENQQSSGTLSNAVLRLNRWLKPCSSICQLEFYYHMFGASDELVISLVEESSKSLLTGLAGDFGDKWNLARVPIGKISQPFQLEFRGVRYFGANDFDLAIDEVRLINCDFPPPRASCPAKYFTCARKSCVPLSQVCDLVDDCGDNSDEVNCGTYTQCDFENGFCDWRHDNESAQLKWELNKGETGLFSTGPTRDHTTGTSTGQYALVRANDQKPATKARLVSPVLKISPSSSTNSCEMRLFYHMYGKDTGTLTVYARSGIGGTSVKLAQKVGEIGNFWERIDLTINMTGPFQVVVEATVGTGPFGDMGIDDISFTPDCIIDDSATLGTETTPPMTTPQPSVCGTNFECKYQTQCVDVSKVCDFEFDCTDKSDEEMCGTCDFEKSECGFKDKSSGRFNWVRAQEPTTNTIPGAGPLTDHTYVNDTNTKGYFAITQLSLTGGTTIGRTDYWGPPVGRTSDLCKFTFWVHMKNPASRISKFFKF